MAKLFHIATVKTRFPDADFWLVRKGSESQVGKPTLSYHPEHIGVKVTATERVLPKYLYYAMTHLHGVGYFRRCCRGTLALKHITVVDVENILLG